MDGGSRCHRTTAVPRRNPNLGQPVGQCSPPRSNDQWPLDHRRRDPIQEHPLERTHNRHQPDPPWPSKARRAQRSNQRANQEVSPPSSQNITGTPLPPSFTPKSISRRPNNPSQSLGVDEQARLVFRINLGDDYVLLFLRRPIGSGNAILFSLRCGL